ncbi:MAG: hypothetical protein HY082_01750 [Gammaproteobacteria bacterium]|nr:hypothetical protein [Gammaproteobacteria bacterium]
MLFQVDGQPATTFYRCFSRLFEPRRFRTFPAENSSGMKFARYSGESANHFARTFIRDLSMKLLESLPDLAGLYVLNPKGELWFYDSNRQYCLDADLTNTLAAHIRDFLAFYLEHPDTCRLASVSPNNEPKPWCGVTLLLEENVVRNLYPAGRGVAKGLTVFQKKNREKSIYRGMELLLRHRHANAADTPVYCPVLFDGGALLNDKVSSLVPLIVEDNSRLPTIEILDLSATVPLRKRDNPIWQTLNQKLQTSFIHEGQRTNTNFEIMENFEWTDAFQEKIDKLHHSERFELVEQWLETPSHPVTPERLSNFFHFRGMDPEKLALVVSKCLIYKAPAGVRLFDAGMWDSWNFYLLDGTVALAADGMAMALVEGNTAKSTTPISFLKPRKYAVTTLTEVSFIWVHDLLLQAIMKDAAKLPPPASSNLRAEASN